MLLIAPHPCTAAICSVALCGTGASGLTWGCTTSCKEGGNKMGKRVLTGTNAVQVQQGLHAHCQPVQELHLLLGLCSFCELFHQSPSVHTTACSAVCCSIDPCHGLPVMQPAVRPHLMMHGVALTSCCIALLAAVLPVIGPVDGIYCMMGSMAAMRLCLCCMLFDLSCCRVLATAPNLASTPDAQCATKVRLCA